MMAATAVPGDLIANMVYLLNLVLLLSCRLDQRSKQTNQRVSLLLLRVILFIPLLAAQYGFSNYIPDGLWVAPLFFSENILILFSLILALRLQEILNPDRCLHPGFLWAIGATAAAVLAVGVGWWLHPPAFQIKDGTLGIESYGPLYFSSLFTLFAVIVIAWRLEAFWKMLTGSYRWRYKYLALGFWLLYGCLVWSTSYRLTYLKLPGNHRVLLALLFITAWLLIAFSVAHHRLLNRQIFISRRVIYSAIAPTIFALYLIGFGLVSLLIRTMGWTLPFVLQWVIIILGLLLIIVLALFRKIRDRVRYFISTHFYLNKYEYRDVWLAFSKSLYGAMSEKEVVAALQQILKECLYTHTILIWLGDRKHGFRLVDEEDHPGDIMNRYLAPNDSLVVYLQNYPFFNLAAPQDNPSAKAIVKERIEFFQTNDLVMLSALLVGEQCVGLIGLGPEYTGGRYGLDDYDLLITLGSHAASALLASRNAEKIAHTREQSAWGILSAFVLHDIKNAATMLDLVLQNAPQYIHDPEFQKDMLASVQDAVGRMTKIQSRLTLLKGTVAPVINPFDLKLFLRESSAKLSKKIPEMTIKVACSQSISMHTDQDFLYMILENLLLNAREAVEDVHVDLSVEMLSEKLVLIRICDTGPGIAQEMLPTRLFEPFVTSKPKGSGIGLWQVKQMVKALDGTILAENSTDRGACFTLQLPVQL